MRQCANLSRFLWVAFQVDELTLQHCDDDIRIAIRNFPKDLQETFDRVVGRIVSRGNENIAKRVLRWVAAAKEPLSLDQLKEVIFVEVGQQYSKGERRSNGIEQIISWCENLVHIDEELKTVQFAHQTIQQFFIEHCSRARHSQFHVKLEEADHYLGEICVTYLNFNDFKTTLARRSRPLAPIEPTTIASAALRHQWKAAASIPNFWKSSSETRVGSAAANAIATLAGFQRDDMREAKERLQVSYPFLGYASIHWIFHTATFQKGKSKTWNIWGEMVLEGHDLAKRPWEEEPFSDSNSLLLEWSQKVRQYALIRLISLSDMLSATDRERIMQNGASEGDITLLDIALEGKSPDHTTYQAWISKACLTAARSGHLDIVKRLLAAGVNGQATLQAAAKGGRLDVVKGLLAAGVNANARPANEYGQTALQAAAEGGHPDTVKSLLAAGADVNAPVGLYGRTALQTAAEGGHLDVVERLLAAGADVSTPGKYGRTALQAAIENGHKQVIETLLAAGAR